MNRFLFLCVAVFMTASFYSCDAPMSGSNTASTELRAPAYPLVTIDPYTSAWAVTDRLFDGPVRHWTGREHPLIGVLRVDGEVYRFLGRENIPLKTLVAAAGEKDWEGKYIFEKPQRGWEKPDFNDKSWHIGKGAFGTRGMEHVRTVWDTREIWIRREVTLPGLPGDKYLYLTYSHDDDFELYINGKEVVNTGNRARSNVTTRIDGSLFNSDGKNVIAIHCTDRGGLAFVDFGIYTESDQKEYFAQTAVQNSVSLSATSTSYSFTCGPVDLDLRFTSPLLPDDLDLLSRPVNYISYQVKANDGGAHDVQIYFEGTPQWAVDRIYQEVEVTKGQAGNVRYLKAGTIAQPVLGKKGDNVCIDWGYFYMAAATGDGVSLALDSYANTKSVFAENGMLNSGEDNITAVMNDFMPAMAVVQDLGSVGKGPEKGYVMIGYDDVESIQYFGTNLKAWWTKDGAITMDQALQSAAADYNKVMAKCFKMDRRVWDETVARGGKEYADLCVLAFRQSIAAHKLVKDQEGNILFLSKENFSNGSIGTVDVTYPSAPLYLKYNPDLLKGMLNPIFYYSESGKWAKPFAAHDVGTYPIANGQTYGGDMPVEECGNMLILTAAIANVEGQADYAERHWKVLTIWADYLMEHGLDPANQLCTDDFAGHFAHNANLSIKAIMGIASYGKLAKMLKKNDVAERYLTEAKKMALEWMKMADDGDHYRLTFDQPGTWSQKYNMVWNKILSLNIFPEEVAQKEIACYLPKQNTYGLPLDSRRTYTKADWIVWTATLAKDKETFGKFISPLHKYVTETPDRVPMSDWFETVNARQTGFQARSVVGGYFIALL